MMCQLCGKRPANICINIEINGATDRRFICDKCADKRGLKENPSGSAILALINDINAVNADKDSAGHNLSDRRCNSCGMTYKDFAKNSSLGCMDCYESFADLLKPIFDSITMPSQEESGHTYKAARHDEIQKLKNLLKQCVEREDYENAAKFRDKIAELEAEEHEVII